MSQYSYVPFFKEVAEKLLAYENRQEELIAILKRCGITEGLKDEDANEKSFDLEEIDPFTFFAFFMKYGDDRRKLYMGKLKDELEISADVPSDFLGVPTAQPQHVWLFLYKSGRKATDIPNLWKLFKCSQKNQIDDELFQNVLEIESVGKAKITETLFYTNPEIFFPIDKQTRAYLERKEINYEFETYTDYLNIINEVKSKINKPLYQISYEAWYENQQRQPRYWRIGTHNNAGENYWDEMKAGNYIAIGWSDLGDLGKIKKLTRQKILERFTEEGYDKDQARNVLSRKAGEIYNFVEEIEEGDIVLTAQGQTVYAIGIVKSDYFFDENISFPHLRNVKWVYEGDALSPLTEGLNTTISELTTKETVNAIKKLLTNISTMSKNSKQPLNQILFGPPGTGKTYSTINKAVEIIDPEYYTKNENNRKQIKLRFEELKNLGQIEFVTFHQSMSYEDFIEGIKPKIEIENFPIGATPTSAVYESKKNMFYDIQSGIFQKISLKAKENYYTSSSNKFEKGNIPFEVVYKILLDELDGSSDGTLKINLQYSHFFITEVDEGSIKMRNINDKSNNTMTESSLRKIYDSKGEMHIRGGMRTYYKALYEKLLEYAKNIAKEKVKTDKKKYVLIIDEINRGNVSQIFGELITLIEDDKRISETEVISSTLAYSKIPFSVPPNLYIVGTMNTADRSVEALDTALRRRFSFKEVIPEPNLISPARLIVDLWRQHDELDWEEEPFKSKSKALYSFLGASFTNQKQEEEIYNKLHEDWGGDNVDEYFGEINFSGINPKFILEAINARIEKLINKDHCIGHSYFMQIYNSNNPLNYLKEIFHDKILPLLQEYFYGDFGKIGLVLGNEFIKVENSFPNGHSFASFTGYDNDMRADLAERPIYKLIPPEKWTVETFTSIYAKTK